MMDPYNSDDDNVRWIRHHLTRDDVKHLTEAQYAERVRAAVREWHQIDDTVVKDRMKTEIKQKTGLGYSAFRQVAKEERPPWWARLIGWVRF